MNASAEVVAFEVALSHNATKESILARVYLPQKEAVTNAVEGGATAVWYATFEVERNDGVSRKRAAGEDWLQALLMAVDGVRRNIPDGEEDLWYTADGVPSWIVLPRQVPIGWGYPLYQHVCSQIRIAEQEAARGAFRTRPGVR